MNKSNYLSRSKFSLAHLSVFIVLFGCIGTYMLFHSSAAPLNTTDAFKKVNIGNGFVEASARQIVRTTGDLVYVITDSDTNNVGLHIYKGNQSGIPTAFSEVDSTHRPTPTGQTFGSPDTRLDRNNTLHIVYNNESNHTLYYQTFNTNTNLWGSRIVIATDAATGNDSAGSFDRTGNAALILDSNDQPNIAYTTTIGTVAFLGANGSGGFNTAVSVASGLTTPIHPVLAYDANNAIHLTWVDNTAALACGSCGRGSPSSLVKYAQRSSTGTWSGVETVASGSNAVDSNVYLDQGPSIVTNSSNIPYIEYIDSNQVLKIKYRTAVNTWADDSPSTSSYGTTHTPSLYAAGNDIYPVLGHDQNIHYGYLYQLGGAGNAWHNFVLLDSTQNDGSASIRWDPFRDNNPGVIDTLYFNETSPTMVYYMAILPSGTGADTTPPTVSVSAPTNGATVSATVSVSATAADNVGVAGVQFKLDGSNLSSEDISSPYSINWNTTTAFDGSHTLTAVARDAAGNASTSSSIMVTVNNAAPTDTTPPTVSISSPPGGSTFNGTVTNVSANASDDVGVSGVQFKLDGANLGSEDTSSPYSISWNTATAPNGSHTLTAVARDAAGNITTSTGIIVTTNSSTKYCDLNGDDSVNIFDLSILLSNYSTTNATADINNDGIVNIFDLSILLTNYGT